MSKPDAPIYQIIVTLKDSEPPIWRRLLISSDTTLYKLHRIIQLSMGWRDYFANVRFKVQKAF